ncbi:hypothetical protein [Allobaculum fili]|uniref:hypothetical protein n=2 Tax=Allobaculum TaxID=174708 RepID=UPI001E5FC047|nr:hypothetical protein [Allobaculum fili]
MHVTAGDSMHIVYNKKNGVLFARLAVSKRVGKTVKKESINLGRVLDKEKGVTRAGIEEFLSMI